MQVLDKGRQRIRRPDGDRRLKLPLDLRCEAAQTLSPVSGHVKAKPWEAWRGIPSGAGIPGAAHGKTGVWRGPSWHRMCSTCKTQTL